MKLTYVIHIRHFHFQQSQRGIYTKQHVFPAHSKHFVHTINFCMG